MELAIRSIIIIILSIKIISIITIILVTTIAKVIKVKIIFHLYMEITSIAIIILLNV